MKIKSKVYENIPFEIVCAGLKGDENGINQVLNFYEPYISKLSTIYLRNQYGEQLYSYVDEDLKQHLRITIVRALKEFAGQL